MESDARLCESDPQVGSVTEAAAKTFEASLGCKLETADPGFESPWNWFSILWVMTYALGLRVFLPEWQSRMDPDLVTVIKGIERVGPTDYGEAVAKRSVLWNTTRKLFGRFDLLLTPTLPVPPFAVGRPVPEGIPAPTGAVLPFPDWVPFTYL